MSPVYRAYWDWARRRERRWARAERYDLVFTDPCRATAYLFFVYRLHYPLEYAKFSP